MPHTSRRALAQRLTAAAGFSHPRVDLEQYPTPPAIAAAIVHRATLNGDIEGCTVLDLGSGPGVLAIASAFRNPRLVVGLERDREAIADARENVERIDPPTPIQWIHGDVLSSPFCPNEPVTALLNPPFGAQRSNRHADRAFLRVASRLADVTYSIHNAGSEAFVRSFAGDNGGSVTQAHAIEMDLERQFDFHDVTETTIRTELYRISW